MTTLAESPVNYLNVRHTVASWLLTKDHKRIGILYMILVTTAFIIGAIFAAGVRLELTTPAGDFVSSDTYNRLFTMGARLRHFARNLLRRGRVEHELTDEFESYADLLIEEKVAQGMSRDEARRSARLEIGRVDQVRERVRDVRVGA